MLFRYQLSVIRYQLLSKVNLNFLEKFPAEFFALLKY